MQNRKVLTLKEQVYNSILDDLLAGKFVGTEVLREGELMTLYDASKSSVREALLELCSNNILRSIPRFGYQIIRLTEDDVKQILMFRRFIEKETLIYIWENSPHYVFKEIKEYLINDRVEPDNTLLEHWLKNKRFHLKLCSYAGNKYIYEQLENAMCVLTRAYTHFHYDEWKNYKFEFSDETHIKILDALIDEDLEMAIKYLIEDIGTFETTLIS